MNVAAQRPSRDMDWVLALGAAVVATLAFGMLWTGAGSGARRADAPEIATLASSIADVRRRARGTLVWEDLSTGARLSEGDAIFVPPASGATVMFNDGTRLELDENTLVALEAPPEGVEGHAVRVARGDVVGASGSAGLSLVGRNAVARLESGSRARLEVDRDESARVEVLQGSARLPDGSRVGEREAVEIEGTNWRVSPGWPVRLETPFALARVFFHHELPALELTFSGAAEGARVQVAAGSFDAPLFDVPSNGTATFRPPGEGSYQWRVVDAAGRPLSTSRRLWVVQDEPPVPLHPRDGDSVAAYVEKEVPFAWSGVQGVGSYELEISRSSEFADSLVRRKIDGTLLREELSLPEGHYHWRVRASSAERGESPWSEPRSFRYLLKPLIDAPELLDPELEVDL